MISLYDKGACPPCPTPFNMAQYVLAKGEETPNKTALLTVSQNSSQEWSYQDLRAAILGTATGLMESGLKQGDIVLLRLGNTVDFPIAYLGALACDLVPVPTSSALTEGETASIIDTLKPSAILRAPDVASPTFDNTISLNRLRDFRTLPPASFRLGDPNRLGYIIFTSGSAGAPRAVAHAHRAIWARRMMFQDWYGMSEDDRLLHAGAFNWTYTLGTGLMDPWTCGATAFDPDARNACVAVARIAQIASRDNFCCCPRYLPTDVRASF